MDSQKKKGRRRGMSFLCLVLCVSCVLVLVLVLVLESSPSVSSRLRNVGYRGGDGTQGEGGRPRGSSQDEGGVEGGEDRGVKVGRVEERKKGREEGSRRAYTTLHYITAARAANPKNRIESNRHPFKFKK